jgi:hypothetical protein
MQGNSIPICHGGYIISYAARELETDRQVSVLLLQALKGYRLSEANVNEYTLEQRRGICSKVAQICVTMNDCGILWPTVSADNFLITAATEIKALDFFTTYTPDKSKPDETKRAQALQNTRVTDFLESCGFGETLKNLLDALQCVSL